MTLNKICFFVFTISISPFGYTSSIHADWEDELLAQNGVIILNENDDNQLLDNGGNLIPNNMSNNIIYIKDTPNATNTIYGGYKRANESSLNSNFNSVIMDKGTIKNIYGGYVQATSYFASSESTANNNILSIYNSSISGDIGGGYASDYASNPPALYSSKAITNNNKVYLHNVDAKNVFAAWADSYTRSYDSTSIVNNNSLIIYDSSISGDIYAGKATAYTSDKSVGMATATATDNYILISNSNMSSVVSGGYASSQAYSAHSMASNNLISIYNSSLKTAIGGHANVNGEGGDSYGYASDNKVSLYDSEVMFIFGGRVSSLKPSVISAFANNNIISLYGNTVIKTTPDLELADSELAGSYLIGKYKYYDIFTGNTLNMGSVPLKVGSLTNFENYNFYINDYNNSVINNDELALITVISSLQNSDSVSEDGTRTNRSNIFLKGISGTKEISVGDTINLIKLDGANVIQGDKSSSITDFFNLNDNTADVSVGLIRSADVSYSISEDGNSVVGTINGIYIDDDKTNKNVKPLAEGRLAGLSNAVRGVDSLINVLSSNHVQVSSFTPIAVLDGGVTKYTSGSYIDSRDYRLLVGSRYQILDNLYAGLAFDYGRSHFDTSNSFSSGDVEGRGNTYNYGVSLFGKYSYALGLDAFYVDGSLRFGRTSTEFNSNDIITGSGESASYKSKANYVGGSVGTGYFYTLNDTYAFDSSMRYFYTLLDSDSVVIDGDKVNFDKSTSSRVQLKEQLNYQQSDTMTFTLAGIYEYEFDGKANANVSGISIDAPNVQGSTGIVELGIKAKPIKGNTNFSVDLIFRGYSGKRDGVNALAMIKCDF